MPANATLRRASRLTPEQLGNARRTRAKLLLLSAGMFAFGFLFALLCRELGRVSGSENLFLPDRYTPVRQVDLMRSVSVEFDAATQKLAWSFRPVEARIGVHPGEVRQVMYEISNTLDRPVTAQAIPAYLPADAERYFKRLECFCFHPQTLAPHETRRVPVIFVIDPALPASLGTVTLSYTFFEVGGAEPIRPAQPWPVARPRWTRAEPDTTPGLIRW
ncbi:MAG TPA: cytochrome c oxidase assembly protein [Burkholderiales bacterium]|nr:cytochrome c oxidase assembly protein [Burkholderiales bacterium]